MSCRRVEGQAVGRGRITEGGRREYKEGSDFSVGMGEMSGYKNKLVGPATALQ